jgi:NAD(P)-dependent dehydrogenase (short-subunit alcohol dehydrogenase family)
VTGASSGLGTRFAKVLHAVGATVVVTARRAERLADLVEELGERAFAVPADIGSALDRAALVASAIERAGGVDVLVNNAGTSSEGPSVDLPLADWSQVIEVNLAAPFHLCQLVGRHMLERGSGSIINVASMLGLVGAGLIPQPAYAASKGGLINMTRELAAEWSRKGVRVNSLCPGYFRTEMNDALFDSESGMRYMRNRTPMGHPGEPGDLDGPLLLLASDASGYMTGATLVVDGGWTAV